MKLSTLSIYNLSLIVLFIFLVARSEQEALKVLGVQENSHLSCIKIAEEQWVPMMKKAPYQTLNIHTCE